MVIVVNERDRAGLEANIAMQRELGIDVRLVSGQELAEIDPNARLAEDELAAYEAEAGYVEAVQVVASFAEAARRERADIRQGVEVKDILMEGDAVVGVETNEGRYDSRTVVLATGPWAAQLARAVKTALPVQACRTQVALFRRPPDFGRRGPVYGDFVQGIYFKPTHGEMIHAGSLAGEEMQDPVDPDAYNEAADGDWLPQVRQRLSRRYPGHAPRLRPRRLRGPVRHHAGLASDPGPPARLAGGLLRRRLQRPRFQDVADRRPADGRADRRTARPAPWTSRRCGWAASRRTIRSRRRMLTGSWDEEKRFEPFAG